ncbi:hypothetical protein B0A50_06583 [Salinomyces thailandicus]|uniref:Required for respiratory growth protein 7, mitochondrial n=1 Tax=Salinomyces thailandicus TaxID=706561 RepID=A0A4U0TRV2_9PEZI|nr:hypothetical protein B0A50_06583 [Salinomyces thailandica]
MQLPNSSSVALRTRRLPTFVIGTVLSTQPFLHVPCYDCRARRYAATSREKASGTDREGNVRDLADLQAALEAAGYGARSVPRTKRKAETKDESTTKAKAPPIRRISTTHDVILPPRLLPPPADGNHHDLASFLAHAAHSDLDPTSTVYRGTHFEYTVADALRAFNFKLRRTGRANDLGIDLAGHWILPAASEAEIGLTMPVLIQCKASKVTPAMVRELEGAYAGAPAGWRGAGVLGVLFSTHAITKGVSAAVQRSQWPLAVARMTPEGAMEQMLWNPVAREAGLEGLGVVTKYQEMSGGEGEEGGRVEQSIGLTWLGKPWNPGQVREEGERAAANGKKRKARETEEEKQLIDAVAAELKKAAAASSSPA